MLDLLDKLYFNTPFRETDDPYERYFEKSFLRNKNAPITFDPWVQEQNWDRP
ncbi:MAG: hypothetical protein AAFX53_10910 [Bacteroidota bacterium]